jgi:hypothetical protein
MQQAWVLRLIQNTGRKTEGKRPLARPRRRWEDNIRMDFREIGFKGVEWMHMDRDRNEWRAFVNFGFQKSRGISGLSDYWLLKRDSAPWSWGTLRSKTHPSFPLYDH